MKIYPCFKCGKAVTKEAITIHTNYDHRTYHIFCWDKKHELEHRSKKCMCGCYEN